MICTNCSIQLTPDPACPDTTYQFRNAEWIGFHGGYGMFTDNTDVMFPTNSDERWLRIDDERDPQWGTYMNYYTPIGADGLPHLVDDPDYKPTYKEERMLPGQPCYEAILCHECMHMLCDLFPGLGRLINPVGSHVHSDEYLAANPDHPDWSRDHRK